jgi:peptide/nickel transport system substrate-binding protein
MKKKGVSRREFIIGGAAAIVVAGIAYGAYTLAGPKIVEKTLEKTVATTVPVEKTLEKTVATTVPVEKTLEKTVATTVPVEKTVEKTVTEEKVVTKTVEVERTVTPTPPPPTRYGGHVKIALAQDPTEFDPHITAEAVSYATNVNMYEPLFIRNEKDMAEPWLVERYEYTTDGKVFTFKLHEGVKFHNGRELTAEDVKWNFERIWKKEGLPAIARPRLAFLEKIEVLDKYTVRFTFTNPMPSFLIGLTRVDSFIILPEIEGEIIKKPWGTGPFKFVESIKAVHFKAERFPDYWGGPNREKRPYLDSFAYVAISDPTIRLAHLQTQEIDGMVSVDPKDVKTVEGDPNLTLWKTTSAMWMCIGMNCKRDPFTDVRIRQAVHYAVDKQEIVDIVEWGIGIPDEIPLAKTDFYYKKFEPWFNPEKGKQLMKDAGYADGLSVTYDTINTHPYNKQSEVIQRQVKKIGMNMELNSVDLATWFKKCYYGRDYQISGVGHGLKHDPDLSIGDYIYTGAPRNWTQFSDPKADELIIQGKTMVDPNKRKPVYDELLTIWVERSGYIQLYTQIMLDASRAYIKNWGQDKDWFFRFKDMYIEKK